MKYILEHEADAVDAEFIRQTMLKLDADDADDADDVDDVDEAEALYNELIGECNPIIKNFR